ncbi:hypothetical protein ACFSNO_06980 [Streptomyces cirratus]
MLSEYVDGGLAVLVDVTGPRKAGQGQGVGSGERGQFPAQGGDGPA